MLVGTTTVSPSLSPETISVTPLPTTPVVTDTVLRRTVLLQFNRALAGTSGNRTGREPQDVGLALAS